MASMAMRRGWKEDENITIWLRKKRHGKAAEEEEEKEAKRKEEGNGMAMAVAISENIK